MTPLELTIGIGIVIFLLFYFAFKLNDDAERDKGFAILKLILILFAVFMLILLPKVAIDYQDHCDFVVRNTTESVGGNFTEYGYDYVCETNPYSTPQTFHKAVSLFIKVFGLFIGVWFTYHVLMYFGLIEYFKNLKK